MSGCLLRMTTMLYRITAFCTMVVALATGLGLLAYTLYPGSGVRLLEHWTALGLFPRRCMALILVLLAMLQLLAMLRIGENKDVVKVAGRGGVVNISKSGIIDFLIKRVDCPPAVISFTPRVSSVRQKIDVVLEVRVKDSPDIPAICENLRHDVRTKIKDGLGIAAVRHVDINLNILTDAGTDHEEGEAS